MLVTENKQIQCLDESVQQISSIFNVRLILKNVDVEM